MIRRYIKRPQVVEAVQWTGDNFDEIQQFIGCFTLHEGLDSALPMRLQLNRGMGNTVVLDLRDYVIKTDLGFVSVISGALFKREYIEPDDLDA